MTSRPKALLAWSSGKDSAWSLHVMRQRGEFEVVGLLTTINRAFGRVAMHAVREEIVEAQAAAAGLPLWKVEIPYPCPNEVYEARMAEAMARAMAAGIETIAFGDLFLEDIRAYREKNLAAVGIRGHFPVWGFETKALAREMTAAGLRAHITAVDPRQLDGAFAGRTFDGDFLDDLPAGVDPCGERGEFHTLTYAGPMFSAPLTIIPGEVVERDGFVFADVRLA